MKFKKQELFSPLHNSTEVFKQKTVAVVGIGGLGSHSAESLIRMGIGNLVLIDDDLVEETNLPRQGLYTQSDSDHSVFKTEAAALRLQEINPDAIISKHILRLTDENVKTLLQDVDLVLDGTDNMTTRYIINDFCFENGIPWIYAAATASVGTLINFIPGKTPCFRCIFGEITEDDASCDRDGVILPTLTHITSLQVTEAIKILLGLEAETTELRYNIWTREEVSVDISGFAEDDCLCRKTKERPKKTSLYMICSGESVQVNTDWSLDEIENRLNQWRFHPTAFGESAKHKDMLIQRFYGDKEQLSKMKRDRDWRKQSIPRAVGYKTGKIVFHHIPKEQIQKWLN